MRTFDEFIAGQANTTTDMGTVQNNAAMQRVRVIVQQAMNNVRQVEQQGSGAYLAGNYITLWSEYQRALMNLAKAMNIK